MAIAKACVVAAKDATDRGPAIVRIATAHRAVLLTLALGHHRGILTHHADVPGETFSPRRRAVLPDPLYGVMLFLHCFLFWFP